MAFKMNGFNPGKGTGIDKNKFKYKTVKPEATESIDLIHEPKSGFYDLDGKYPLFQNPLTDNKSSKRKINKAKKLVKKHIEHTTVDSPTYGTKKSDRKFPRSEKKMIKAINLLRDQGYSEEDIEQFTGATGYQDAMDWATEPMVTKRSIRKKSKSPMKKNGNGKRGYDTGGFEANEEKAHTPISGFYNIREKGYVGPTINLVDSEKGFLENLAKKRKGNKKRRLKEVKSSIRDLKIERIKKIGNKRAQDNLKSAIAGLKQKKKQLKNK
jgi:hypothetical protein